MHKNYKQKYHKYKLKYLALKEMKGGYDDAGNKCIKDCIYVHKQDGLNYPWLNDVNGGLDHIEYMEPPNDPKQEWKQYGEHQWHSHCTWINHDPDVTVDEHIKAFVNPETRFAKLRFFFKNGKIIELDYDHAKDFYQREADYFREHNICKGFVKEPKK